MAAADSFIVDEPRRSRWPDWTQRYAESRLGVAAAAFLLFVVVAAVLAPFVAPYHSDAVDPAVALTPPGAEHLMGTDNFGRDIWSRALFGARLSLMIGISATAIGGVVGLAMGTIAGYWGGLVDEGLMRIVDVMLAFPGVLLAMAIVAMLGPSIVNLVVAVGIGAIPGFARLMRSATLSVRSSDYVRASEAIGGGPMFTIRTHVLPNTRATFVVYATLSVATSILYAAALGFLGLGSKPPTPEWGLMVSDGREFLAIAWWISTFPGLAIILTTLSISIIGETLNNVLDPRRGAR